MITRTMQRVIVAVMCFGILASLFGCNKNTHVSDEWQSMSISRNHSNWNYCFSFSISTDELGKMLATGHCRDMDGNDYSHDEDPIVLSEKCVTALREMKLEKLEKEKKKNIPGLQVMDETTQKLVLTYKDGAEENKELSDDTLQSIFDLLIEEFKHNSIEN